MSSYLKNWYIYHLLKSKKVGVEKLLEETKKMEGMQDCHLTEYIYSAIAAYPDMFDTHVDDEVNEKETLFVATPNEEDIKEKYDLEIEDIEQVVSDEKHEKAKCLQCEDYEKKLSENILLDRKNNREYMKVEVSVPVKFHFPLGFSGKDFDKLCCDLKITKEMYIESISKDILYRYQKSIRETMSSIVDVI